MDLTLRIVRHFVETNSFLSDVEWESSWDSPDEESSISSDNRIPFSEIEQSGHKLLEQLREFNPDLTYDDASIEWLEGFAQRNRDVFSE